MPSFSAVVVCNPQGVTSCFSGDPGTANPHWLGDPLLRFDPCHMTSSPGCSCQSLTVLDFHRKCLTVITWTSTRVQPERLLLLLLLCCRFPLLHIQFFCLFGLATSQVVVFYYCRLSTNYIFLLVWPGHCRFLRAVVVAALTAVD